MYVFELKAFFFNGELTLYTIHREWNSCVRLHSQNTKYQMNCAPHFIDLNNITVNITCARLNRDDNSDRNGNRTDNRSGNRDMATAAIAV